jgi:hypothetical protein
VIDLIPIRPRDKIELPKSACRNRGEDAESWVIGGTIARPPTFIFRPACFSLYSGHSNLTKLTRSKGHGYQATALNGIEELSTYR